MKAHLERCRDYANKKRVQDKDNSLDLDDAKVDGKNLKDALNALSSALSVLRKLEGSFKTVQLANLIDTAYNLLLLTLKCRQVKYEFLRLQLERSITGSLLSGGGIINRNSANFLTTSTSFAAVQR